MSSMSNNSTTGVPRAAFLAARKAWPERGHDDRLADPVRQVYDAWRSVAEADRLEALEAAGSDDFPRLPGKDSERAKCRDLTLTGSPLPAAHSDVQPLTIVQIEAMGVPPLSRGRTSARSVTPAAASDGRMAVRSQSLPAARESADTSPERDAAPRGSSPAAQASPASDRRVAELERRIAQQDERIRQLFAQQLAEPNEDVSSAYVVMDEVWHKLGKSPTDDRCSWLSINALKKREVSEIIRLHSGTFPHFPCELDVIGAMKKLPGVKDAQITLVEFAQTEVAKFMRANARTVRLSGTVFSRTLEMQRDLSEYRDNDPDATEIPLDWVVEFVDKVVGTARGTFAMSLDTQTSLRLAVSHRLEKAMKVDHLTANPLKAEREDFVPPLVMKRIEDAAKRNLDLTWALDQASGKQAFSGRHPANSSRGGKAEYARQRGRGGGAPKGAPKGGKGGAGGRGGRGRGRGTSTTPRADSARADASPDE